jgi:carbamoyl-phosphate synthase small subunit
MTYPLIGNYGCNEEDFESGRPHVEGFIVREYSSYFSNWRATKSLDEFLSSYGIMGIQGIDTRALTKRLREHGVMKGVISTGDLDRESLVAKAKASPGLVGLDLVKHVTCEGTYHWYGGETDIYSRNEEPQPTGTQLELDFSRPASAGRSESSLFQIVAVDSGIKYNILRKLQSHGCDVTVVPATTSAEEILAFQPEGIFLANGPGDPEGVPYLVDAVKELIGKKPIFGICLGHQILGLAFGGKSFKLRFGHRGANQPVKDLVTGKVEITSQNHGFCIDKDSLKDKPVKLTHINLNDDTLEGMEHEEYPIFSVQYHPEASPGPHDANYLFERFMDMMRKDRSTGL